MRLVVTAEIVNRSRVSTVGPRKGALEALPIDLKIGTGICWAWLGAGGNADACHTTANRFQLSLHMIVLRELLQTPVAAISDGGLDALAPQTERLTKRKSRVDMGGVC